MPEADNKLMFELFPDGGAAKQGCRIAGLPQPYGKGGY
jgi:tRNA 2-thiouridine synthesizing protein E